MSHAACHCVGQTKAVTEQGQESRQRRMFPGPAAVLGDTGSEKKTHMQPAYRFLFFNF